MNMSITIQTEDPEAMQRVLAALAGVPAAVPAPLANPPKAPKAEKQKEAPAPEQPVAAAPVAAAPSATLPAPAVQDAPASAHSDYVPDEAELTAAANSAIAKLGAGAQAKVKEYIAKTFQKEDGTAAGLRTVRADQRAQLLADLKAFATGEKVI